jgi:hypothetical protein
MMSVFFRRLIFFVIRNKLSMRKLLAILLLPSLWANDACGVEVSDASVDASEFHSEETYEAGFLTSMLNTAIEKNVGGAGNPSKPEKEVKYGRNISDYCSMPKFGGYIIGKYSYSDKEGAESGDGFNARLIRVYVDGTILKDFKYRLQVELNNSPHVKDYQLEWARFKEFSAKIGQFKRPFTFENPYNPWNVGIGDYSQLTKKLAGMGDYNGEPSMGGRDQGFQVQGELLKVGKDSHRLIQYQLGVFNGQGINRKEANKDRDIIGNIKFQPIKGLLIGAFGWAGTYTADGVTVDRNRWAVGATYDNASGWVARAEYAHSQGHKISDIKADGTVVGTGRADAWYAMMGVPCNNWLKVCGRYDAYRDQATWGSLKTIYSICPNFQLHKNLMFQVQYNYVNDKTSADHHYNEVWVETYVRF